VKAGGTNAAFQAILIGGSEFMRYAETVLEAYQIPAVNCEDIYSATAELAKAAGKRSIVIGTYSRLNKERGSFLRKLSAKKLPCCCLCDINSPRSNKPSSDAEATTIFINEAAELEEALGFMIDSGHRAGVSRKESDDSQSFNKDEFLTTKAELEALLETNSFD